MSPIHSKFASPRVNCRVQPLVRESAVSLQGMEGCACTLGDATWEKARAKEESRLGMWLGVPLLCTLVVVMYAPVIGSLARQWWNDANYSHGIFVPLFAAYVLWRERDRWQSQPLRANDSGFVIMLFAIGLLVLGTLGAELFTSRLSLLVLICGIVIFLAGYRRLRSIAFPMGYLLFMIPLPAIIYYQLTFPLQLLASRLGANGLIALGVHTVRQGNLLILPNCTLNVVEACSGIRSLLSLLAAVVAYAYLAEPTVWKRVALALASVPIAIATNGLRLVATGVLSVRYGPTADSGLVHLALGLFFFGLALLAVLYLHKLLRLFSGSQDRALVHP